MGGLFQSQQPTTTTTNQVELTPQQKEIMNLAMPDLRNYAGSNVSYYPNSTVAPFNSTQKTAQQMALGAAGGQADVTGSAATANKFLSGDIWDSATNPILSKAIDAGVRPIYQNLNEKVLPGIRSGYSEPGHAGYGGSRQGIAEGLASRGASMAAGDTAAKISNAAYDTNINAMLKSIGLAPQTAQALTMPAQTVGAVGDVNQTMDQAQINDLMSRFNFSQYAPFMKASDLVGLVSGMPGAGSTSTVTGTPGQQSPMMKALGGGAAGASIGSSFGPMGAGVGGGLGALMALLSK